MNKQIEMHFNDDLEEFMKLVEALNAGDQVCPVYLAFNGSNISQFMMVTASVRARLEMYGEGKSTKEAMSRMEKLTFVVRPSVIHWSPLNISFSSVDPIPF